MDRKKTAQVRKHLSEGYALTPLEAASQFHTMRLSAIVEDLRLKGLKIYATKARFPVTGAYFAVYYIPAHFMDRHMEYFKGRFGTGHVPELTQWLKDKGLDYAGHYPNSFGLTP